MEVKEATDEETTTMPLYLHMYVCMYVGERHALSVLLSRNAEPAQLNNQNKISKRGSFHLLGMFLSLSFSNFLTIGQERLTSADAERITTNFICVCVCISV